RRILPRSDANRRRRQPALASPHRDRQLPAWAGLGPRRGRRRAARDRRVRAVGAERPEADPGIAHGPRRRAAATAPPAGAVVAVGLEPLWPAFGRERRRAARRLPLLRLDVPAAARRGTGDDRARPGAAAIPAAGRAKHAPDA